MRVWRALKKRNPLSTAETIADPTSPSMKRFTGGIRVYRSSKGLVGLLWASFKVSELDTFIEKPSSVHFFGVCLCCFVHNKCPEQMRKNCRIQAGGIAFALLWLQGSKGPASQMISYSVEG